MKRICIVRINYYPDEPHLRRDAEALVSAGYSVDVICLKRKGQKSREVIDGVNIYRLGLDHRRAGGLRYVYEYLAFFTLALGRLTLLSLKRHYTAVQVINLPDFLVFTAIVPKFLGAKVALNFFELMPEVFADQFNIKLSHPLVKIFLGVDRVSAAFADEIIAANGVLQQERLGENGIKTSKIASILNVPDGKVFYPRPQVVGQDTYKIVTHGSILERYGLQYLIKAVSLEAKNIPGMELIIIGEGEYRPQLEQLAVSLGVSDKVRFTGRLALDKMIELIAGADVGAVSLLPQKQPQMPCKLFEYLAMGKPVICSSLPALTPYFTNDAVMYYPPEDEKELSRCLLELYRNPAKRISLAAAGAANYDKYCWTRQKQQYLQIFKQMTNDRNDWEPVEATNPE
jgi:glycosyltransferase involved in cell wall biosynthesis